MTRCQDCGSPLASLRCDACGAAQNDAGLGVGGGNVDAASLLALREEDFPSLKDAFAAHRAKDWPRYVSSTLLALMIDRTQPLTQGNLVSWGFKRGSAVVVVSLDRADLTIAVEAPVVDIRKDTEVPLLRAVLSAGGVLGLARPVKRGHRLLLSMLHHVGAMPPPRLALAIEEVASAADALDNILAAEFGVRMLGPQMTRPNGYDLSVIGTPRRLANIVGGGAQGAPSGGPAKAPSSSGGITRLLELCRDVQQICMGFGFAPVSDAVEGALHVGAAHVVALEAGLDVDGARLLLRHAQAVRAQKAPPSTTRQLYLRIMQERGLTAAVDAVALAPIPSSRVKGALGDAVLLAGQAQTAAVRRLILLGALAELILAGELHASITERLRGIYDGHQGVDSKTVQALLSTLQGMTR